jgi:hypothetical protein
MILFGLVTLALIEVAIVFVGLARATRDIRRMHDAIAAAGSPSAFARALDALEAAELAGLEAVAFPADWIVSEKAGRLSLCHAHLEMHDQETGVHFTPLEPALAGSQCAACLREAAIYKARNPVEEKRK